MLDTHLHVYIARKTPSTSVIMKTVVKEKEEKYSVP